MQPTLLRIHANAVSWWHFKSSCALTTWNKHMDPKQNAYEIYYFCINFLSGRISAMKRGRHKNPSEASMRAEVCKRGSLSVKSWYPDIKQVVLSGPSWWWTFMDQERPLNSVYFSLVFSSPKRSFSIEEITFVLRLTGTGDYARSKGDGSNRRAIHHLASPTPTQSNSTTLVFFPYYQVFLSSFY